MSPQQWLLECFEVKNFLPRQASPRMYSTREQTGTLKLAAGLGLHESRAGKQYDSGVEGTSSKDEGNVVEGGE